MTLHTLRPERSAPQRKHATRAITHRAKIIQNATINLTSNQGPNKIGLARKVDTVVQFKSHKASHATLSALSSNRLPEGGSKRRWVFSYSEAFLRTERRCDVKLYLFRNCAQMCQGSQMLSSLPKKLEPGEAKGFWPVQRVREEEM